MAFFHFFRFANQGGFLVKLKKPAAPVDAAEPPVVFFLR